MTEEEFIKRALELATVMNGASLECFADLVLRFCYEYSRENDVHIDDVLTAITETRKIYWPPIKGNEQENA